MKAASLFLLLFLVVSPFLLSGCVFPGRDGFPESSWTTRVTLRLDNAGDLLSSGAKVTLTVETRQAFERLEAGVNLPPNIRLVSGDLSFDEEAETGTRELSGVIRADAPGTYVLRGWANAGGTCDLHDFAADSVQLSATTKRVETKRLEEPYSELKMRFEYLPGDPGKVAVHVSSPVQVQASVCINTTPFEGGLAYPDGGEWAGNLRVGNHTVDEFGVAAPGDGVYQVHGWLRPHASFSSKPVETGLFLTQRDGIVTASTTAPRLTS